MQVELLFILFVLAKKQRISSIFGREEEDRFSVGLPGRRFRSAHRIRMLEKRKKKSLFGKFSERRTGTRVRGQKGT